MVEWVVRGSVGSPERRVFIEMSEHEMEWYRGQYEALRGLERGSPEFRAVLNETCTIMEAKALLHAHIVDERPLLPGGGRGPVTGKYHGREATATERASGVAAEIEDQGPLRAGGAGHRALMAFGSGERMTAYDASERAVGDFHAIRREATRLLTRGYLRKNGTLSNPAPRGREHVDAYVLTEEGRCELERLGS